MLDELFAILFYPNDLDAISAFKIFTSEGDTR